MIETDEQRRWWFATHPEFSWSRRGIGSRKDKDDADEAFKRFLKEAIELDKKGLIKDPHTSLDLAPFRRLLTSPVGFIKGLARSAAQGAVVHAARKGGKGPGEWVEVGRSRIGLAHQSKMSGQSIREKDGKFRIKEYDVNGVKFDDYRNGKLYEYKGPHGNLLNEDGLFKPWVRGVKDFKDQATAQVEAARGIPVIWRVGKDQVRAFKEVLKGISGVTVKP
jgi:hypothetical protein